MTADTIETPLKKVELTADEKRKRLDDHYEAIKEAEFEVQEAQGEMLSKQQELKDAKKAYESAVFSLRRLIVRAIESASQLFTLGPTKPTSSKPIAGFRRVRNKPLLPDRWKLSRKIRRWPDR